MSSEHQIPGPEMKSFREEFFSTWQQVPFKGLFLGLLLGWMFFFHFLGNSTLGYIDTSSLFGWMNYAYSSSADDEHGKLIPFVVMVLFWWKRKELLSIEKRHWWPALGLIIFSLLLHIVGFMVQQTRVSIVAFFVGIYGLTGLVWGPRWLQASFFPFFLFAFCLPLGTLAETITFPLRMVVTKCTTVAVNGLLGMDVIQDGTRIFNAGRTFEYEVAAACSGMRSLTATLAMSTILAFVKFNKYWKRFAMIGAAFPLAIIANIFRLTLIIMAAEMFGHEAGDYVHNSTWLSLLPYVPAIVGLILLEKWLKEDKQSSPEEVKA